MKMNFDSPVNRGFLDEFFPESEIRRREFRDAQTAYNLLQSYIMDEVEKWMMAMKEEARQRVKKYQGIWLY